MKCVMRYWSNVAELPALAHTYNMEVTPRSVSVTVCCYCTVCSDDVGKCLLHAQNEQTIAALRNIEKVYRVATSMEETIDLNGCVEELS